MGNEKKKYASLNTLSLFLDNIKNRYAQINHQHSKEDIPYINDIENNISSSLQESKDYTDIKIANLINGAPTTLDTLGEIATAMEENDDMVQVLHSAIGSKANINHTHTASEIADFENTVIEILQEFPTWEGGEY